MDTLSVAGHQIHCGPHAWNAPYPIHSAAFIEGVVVLVYRYDAAADQPGQFQNLRGFSPAGELLWIAEHPTNTSADTYVDLLSEVPLRASNFAGYVCEIDPRTGRILHATFTK